MIALNEIFESELYKEIIESTTADIKPNQVILKEGSYIKEVPILIEGSIKVRKIDASGKEIVFYHIQPGDSCILSITSCLNDKQSSAEAITETNSKIIIISTTHVKEWMDKYKTWRKFIMKLYYERLGEVLSLVDSIAFKQVDIRLLDKLREKSNNQLITITTTHQQLANELGTAREVVSRLLKQLEKQGLILLDRGIIKILRPL